MIKILVKKYFNKLKKRFNLFILRWYVGIIFKKRLSHVNKNRSKQIINALAISSQVIKTEEANRIKMINERDNVVIVNKIKTFIDDHYKKENNKLRDKNTQLARENNRLVNRLENKK